MDQGPKDGRLSRRQRRDLARLEQELVADVHLCRWFDRLASGEPPTTPDEARMDVACSKAARSVQRSSEVEQPSAVTEVVFAVLVLAAAALTISGALLRAPVLAVMAIFVFLLAPVSVLAAHRVGRRHDHRPETRPGTARRPGSPRGWSGGGTWSPWDGGMWLLP
jgi:hypothetical protein